MIYFPGFGERPRRSFFLSLIFVIVLLSTASVPFAQDQIGVFWDSGYLENEIEVELYPTTMTGYLILIDPTEQGDIVGWECCVDIEGPAQILSWQLQGEVVNAAPTPCFKVNVGGTPLPGGSAVLLATFEVEVTGPGPEPVAISVAPLTSQPSLPGEMIYRPAWNPTQLAPLESYTGEDVVAWINRNTIPVVRWNIPGFVDFGFVTVGQSRDWDVLIENTGNVAIPIDASLDGCGNDFSILVGGDPFVLDPGQSATLTLSFHPDTEEVFTCQLELGEVIPGIPLNGRGREPQLSWYLSDQVLDYGERTASVSWTTKNFRIKNTGEVDLALNIVEVVNNPDFYFSQGGGQVTLEPEQSVVVVVTFHPHQLGGSETYIHLNEFMPLVHCFGIGVSREPESDCFIEYPEIIFESINIGEADEQFFSVTNRTGEVLHLDPVSSNPTFRVIGGRVALAPGQTTTYSVVFRPLELGSQSTTIELGPDACSAVACTGIGLMATSNIDLVGFYFDQDATSYLKTTQEPNQVVTAYLVMSKLSNTSGVAGWECRVGVEGIAGFIEQNLRGSYVNAGIGNEFIVGIAEAPLPFAETVVLADFELLIVEPYPSEVSLQIRPVRFPTIEHNMCWLPWDSPESPRPMGTVTGSFRVAWVNANAPLAAEFPSPRISLDRSLVRLQWSVSVNEGRRFHVYRRAGTSAEVRLTTSPLIASGPDLEYLDDPGDTSPGTFLYYSYAVIENGIEIARSPEVSIALGSQVPRGTRLLANYPNPFNPQTEIPFELSQPGMVRLAIYDVTGRLVRILVSGSMDPGAYARTWMGRDDAGRAVPSGAYYVRLVTDQRVDSRKMMLLR